MPDYAEAGNEAVATIAEANIAIAEAAVDIAGTASRDEINKASEVDLVGAIYRILNILNTMLTIVIVLT